MQSPSCTLSRAENSRPADAPWYELAGIAILGVRQEHKLGSRKMEESREGDLFVVSYCVTAVMCLNKNNLCAHQQNRKMVNGQ